jgi:hypothetical protein
VAPENGTVTAMTASKSLPVGRRVRDLLKPRPITTPRGRGPPTHDREAGQQRKPEACRVLRLGGDPIAWSAKRLRSITFLQRPLSDPGQRTALSYQSCSLAGTSDEIDALGIRAQSPARRAGRCLLRGASLVGQLGTLHVLPAGNIMDITHE